MGVGLEGPQECEQVQPFICRRPRGTPSAVPLSPVGLFSLLLFWRFSPPFPPSSAFHTAPLSLPLSLPAGLRPQPRVPGNMSPLKAIKLHCSESHSVTQPGHIVHMVSGQVALRVEGRKGPTSLCATQTWPDTEDNMSILRPDVKIWLAWANPALTLFPGKSSYSDAPQMETYSSVGLTE